MSVTSPTFLSGFVSSLFVSLSLCFLALHAPSVALSLLHGQPSLSSTAFTGAALAGGIAGMSAVRSTTALGTGSVAKAAGMAAQGFSSTRENYASSMGGQSGESGFFGKATRATSEGVVGTLGGMGGVAAGTLNNVAKSNVIPIMDHLSHNYSRGKQSLPKLPGFRQKRNDSKETKE